MLDFIRSLGSRLEKVNKSIKHDKDLINALENDNFLKN